MGPRFWPPRDSGWAESEHAIDVETYDEDYLSNTEWKALELIADQLEPLFRATKSLKGNTKLNEGIGKPSHSALWELLCQLVKMSLIEVYSRVLGRPFIYRNSGVIQG